MKSTRGILAGLLLLGMAGTIEAQDENTTRAQVAPRPAVAFPPTPTPAPKEEPLTPEALDVHLVPSQFLQRTSDVLTLVYNGFRRSQIDPCGCVTHQLGGLAKEAKLIQRLEELKLPLIQVDAGGFARDMPDQKMITQAKYVVKGLGKIGYDVINVGFTDTAIPASELKQVASEAGISLVSANIQDGSGRLEFEPYVIKEVTLTNGQPLKVGVIGVTRPRLEAAGVPAAQPPAVANGSSDTITITDPIEALNQHLPALGEKADFIVVLDYDRRTNAEKLLKGLKNKDLVDVLVLGENNQIQGSVQAMDGVQVVSGGYEGRQLGTLYMELKDKNVASTWNKHIEVVQTIPSVPEIEKMIEEAHEATKAISPARPTVPGTTTGPAKLNLGL